MVMTAHPYRHRGRTAPAEVMLVKRAQEEPRDIAAKTDSADRTKRAKPAAFLFPSELTPAFLVSVIEHVDSPD